MTTARGELLHLQEKGHLWRRYIIENNTKLENDFIEVLKCDNLVQTLLGDELKQDQFEFLYDTVKIVYDCALQSDLVNMNKPNGNKRIGEIVIPELVAFKAIMKIRDI